MRLPNPGIVRTAGLLGGSVLLVSLFIGLGPARILSLLASLGWNFAVLVALFSAHEFVRSLAITRWLPADRRLPAAEVLRIRLLGEAAGALTRSGALAAEPTRAWLLANRSGQAVTGYSAAAGELLANTATGAAVNIAVAGSVLWRAALSGPVVVLAHVLLWGSLVYLSVVVSIVLSRVRLLVAGVSWAARLPVVGARLRLDPARAREMGQAIGALMERPAELARIVLLELSAQTLLVCEVFWAIRSMGVSVSAGSALLFEVMPRAFTVVEIAGATEMGFAIVFAWLGLPATIGFTLSLVKTLRSLTVGAVAIGLWKGAAFASRVLVATPRMRDAVPVQEAE